jgi:hypothetical protein
VEPAQKICEALRAAGIEVWFDQSELRGGDAWDQKIRREIHDCALFIPVISANTASRHEGYFRLEWDLADQRSHMMARSRVFVVPVCLDATTEMAADVPESFQRVQWTRLPGGVTPAAFVERVRRLLSGEPALGPSKTASAGVRVARKDLLALEACAARNDCGARRGTRLPCGKPSRAFDAWRGDWSGIVDCDSERSSHRLHPATALDRSAAVREPERRA